MFKCGVCGEDLDFPFICNYCGGHYCPKHRLPESHRCEKKPDVSPISFRFSQNRVTAKTARKMGKCPRCHKDNCHILKFDARKTIFRCLNCSLVYGQWKNYPYKYFHVRRRTRVTSPKPYNNPTFTDINRKKSSAKKVIIAGTVIISLLVIILLSGLLSNLDAPISNQQPISNPSPIAITGRVVAGIDELSTSETVSGVEINVADSQGNIVMTGQTNATGSFSFDNLPQSTYDVSITIPYGYMAISDTSYSVSISHDLEFKIYNVLTNPKTMHYHYTLRGVSSQLSFTVYGGLYDYLVSSEYSTVTYYSGQQPSREEISRTLTLRYVNEEVEKVELQNLVSAIQKITSNEDDQARIAISLVQNIPYDNSAAATISYDWKYPYEILYSNTGVCSEKSCLLVCILRELGYGCSILEFPSQNHAAVGIACPSQYAYNSGYAFVESTSPIMITYWQGDYVGAGKLPSSPDYVIEIQEGKAMNTVSEEYQDAQNYQSLLNMGPVLDEAHYAQWQTLVSKYGIKVS